MTDTIEIDDLRLDLHSGFSLAIEKLTIKKGEILSIIGPNGAGKSTLLNILALFQKPESGSVNVFGKNILNGIDPLHFRRSISFVLSRPFLLDRSVFDNVNLPLKLRGGKNKGLVEEALDFFSIRNLMQQNALSLSQGEMHKVSLARAFVTKPRLLLLDEPFISLDSMYKKSLMSDLRSLIKSQETTTIFVTQDQGEALLFADRMAVMDQGRIVQAGEPREIFTRPASRDIADFIGMETVIDGVIAEKTGDLCSVKVGDIILNVISECREKDRVGVCIRHEDIVLSLEGDTVESVNTFSARIVAIEPFKLSYKLHLDCGFEFFTIVSQRKIDALSLNVDMNVQLSFKETAPHLIRS